MKRLMRYVLWKTAWSFLLAVSALEGVLLMSALFELIQTGARWGISASTVLKCIPFLMLERASFAIPLAAAAAGAHVFSGMAASNELVAVQSMGRDVRRLLWPLLFVGVVLVGVSLVTDELGRGYGMRRIKAMATNDAERFLENRFRSGESINLGGGGMHYWLTMRKGAAGRLPWVSVMYYKEETLRLAAAGEMRSFRWFRGDEGRGVILELVNIIGQKPGQGGLRLKEGVFTCKVSDDTKDIYIGNRAANRNILGNLAVRRQLKRMTAARAEDVFGLMVDAGLYSGWTGRTENGAAAGHDWAAIELKALLKESRQAKASIHTALGLALAPMVLLVMGAALGAGMRFRNRASAFLWTVVIVVMVYYPVTMAARGMIEEGGSYAVAIPYTLDAVILLAGLLYWRRASGGIG